MPDFLITFSSNTAQSLLTGERGVVGTSGTLAVSDAQAIGVESEADLLILGSVTALKGDGVGGPAVGILELVVGTTGHLTSLDDAAVDIAMAGSAVTRNQGNIIGSAAGIVAVDTDGSAGFRLSNGGTIVADGAALLLSLGNGTVKLTNSGRIETQGNASAAAIDAEGGVIVFDQTGTVVGDVLLASTFSTRLVNAGTILGNVFLGTSASADSFVNLGGRVSGTIFGGAGDDTYTIDRGDLVVSDSSGVDTVRSSASYQLGAGLDILTLTGSADIAGTGNGSSNFIDGTGADRFIFGALTESTVAASDVISDFDGVTDRIDLSAIDANGATAGDGSFLFGGANFLAVGIASIRVVVSSGNTTVEIRDKDGSAVDMQIDLDGVPALTAADFVL